MKIVIIIFLTIAALIGLFLFWQIIFIIFMLIKLVMQKKNDKKLTQEEV